MFQEFKKFAIRGNLIDIAIGLVMATAFGAVTSAFVEGFFLPIVGEFFQVGDMAQAKLVLSKAVYDAEGKIIEPESAIFYGKLISSIINFIIIAFVMFLIIKIMNKLKHEEPPVEPSPPTQEQLLTEIRDLLRNK
jgi:large conductance mechanosensitive channel